MILGEQKYFWKSGAGYLPQSLARDRYSFDIFRKWKKLETKFFESCIIRNTYFPIFL